MVRFLIDARANKDTVRHSTSRTSRLDRSEAQIQRRTPPVRVESRRSKSQFEAAWPTPPPDGFQEGKRQLSKSLRGSRAQKVWHLALVQSEQTLSCSPCLHSSARDILLCNEVSVLVESSVELDRRSLGWLGGSRLRDCTHPVHGTSEAHCCD